MGTLVRATVPVRREHVSEQVLHKPKVRGMLQLPEVLINEVVLLDFGDDGAAFLCPVPLVLRLRSWAASLLHASRLMRRLTNRRRHPEPRYRDSEQCPFCKAALSDQWITAAHSRVAGRWAPTSSPAVPILQTGIRRAQAAGALTGLQAEAVMSAQVWRY